MTRKEFVWTTSAPALCLALLVAWNAAAQPPEVGEGDDEPAARIERSIVVTAAEPDLEEAPTEERVGVEELREDATRDLGEAMRHRPGLSAVRRGPVNLDPSVRGLQEGQVAVLVDGTRTFAAGPARMDSDLAHVDPDAIERLRVVKGPYALTWGAGALAAIEADTFRPAFRDEPAWGGEFHGGWGENGSVSDGAATLYRGGARTRFALVLSDRRGDDYQAGDGSEVPADFSSSGARWSFGYRPSDERDLMIDYRGGYQEQHDIDYPGRILDASYFYTRSHALDLEWHPRTGAGSGAGPVGEVHAQLYSNRKDHRMNNDEKPTALPMPGRVPPFGIDVDLPAESDTTGGRFHVVLGGGAVRWKLGGDHYSLDQSAFRTVSRRDTGAVLFEDAVWPDAEIDDTGLYAQAVWRRRAVDLSGTVRADRWEAGAGELSPFFVANTSGDPDREESTWSAALSGHWRVGGDWLLTGGIGRAVRTPSVLELYSDRFPSTRFQVAAELLGNPGLDPEVSHQVDLGTEGSVGSGAVSVDLFYRVIDDYITVRPDPSVPRRLPLSPPTVFRYVNGDRATYWGGELGLRHRLGDRFLGRLSASWIRGRDETFDEPAFGVPPLTAEAGLRWEPGERWWLDAAVLWADDQDRVAVRRLEQPTEGSTRVDLRASWRPSGELEVLAGIENLFDEAYADHLNALDPFTGRRVLEPGRNAHVDLVYRF